MNTSFNNIAASVALIIGLGACTGAMAAEQVAMQVTGNIKPSSCDISINGDSVLDYGDVYHNNLNKTKWTDLQGKRLKINIDCMAPTSFAVRSTDLVEGAGTEAAAAIGSGIDINGWFSLGKTENGKIIGGYRVYIAAHNVLVDNSKPKKLIQSKDEGATWTSHNNLNISVDGKTLTSWDMTGSNTPNAAQNVSWDAVVTPTIVAFDNIFTRDDIKMGGNATFDVVYL